MTGDREAIRRVRVAVRRIDHARRSAAGTDITHNLRTAVVGADGTHRAIFERKRLDAGRAARRVETRRVRKGGSAAATQRSAAAGRGRRAAAVGLHAGRAARDAARAHARRRTAIPERAALQHRAAARRRDPSLLSRRRAAPLRRTASKPRLAAAVILEQHGWPPLVLSFESIDELDHVLFVYRHRGRWGSIGRSRDPGLHGRRAVFATPRALALSYVDAYVDFTGRVTGYAVADLRDIGNYDWRLVGRQRLEGRADAAESPPPAAAARRTRASTGCAHAIANTGPRSGGSRSTTSGWIGGRSCRRSSSSYRVAQLPITG